MSGSSLFVRAVPVLFVSLVVLSAVSSIAQVPAEKEPPPAPPEVLATRQMQSGKDSYQLVLARMESAGIMEKQLPAGIPFRAPRLEPWSVSANREPQPAKSSAVKIEGKAIYLDSFANTWGNKMFLLYKQPPTGERNLVVVPLFGLCFNIDFPTRNYPYSDGGSIAATGDPTKVLVILAGSEGGDDGHIAAYMANLTEPAAHGLYEDGRIRMMANEPSKPTQLLSEFEFTSPWRAKITSVDSLLLKEDELLVVVRFFGKKGTYREDTFFEKQFRLNLKTKEWKLLEEETPK